MKIKRVLMLFAASVMLVTQLAACGSGGTGSEKEEESLKTQPSETENEAEKSGASEDAGETEDSDIMTPFGRYEEPVTITTAKVAITNPHFPEGKSSSDNVTIDWIKEKLNVDVDILWEADGSEYINKLSLAITSGGLPDMIFVSDYSMFKTLVENDMLADLTEAYEKCAGNYMKSTFDSYGGKNLEPCTFDGKLYAIPGASLGYTHDVLWIRKDWLDKLGLEEPKTLEDIKNIAREFIEKDPGGNGAGNTIGIAVNATQPVGGCGNYGGLEPIFNMLGVYPRQWMEDENGQVYYGSTVPEMKEGLQIARDMYDEGLIDKSFVIRTNPGELSALINSNQVGMYFGQWWTAFERQDLAKEHPESDWIAVNAPLDEEGKFKHEEPSPAYNFLCVRKGFEHPEVIVKILNLEQEMARGYMEGGTEAIAPYKEAGTNWVAWYPTGDINLEYYDIVPKTGHYIAEYLKDNSFAGDELTTEQDRTSWKYAQEYVDTKDVNSPGWGEYYARYIGSTILDSEECVGVPSAYYYTTDSSADYKADLDKLEDEMYLKIITGEEDIDYFDEFVETWNALGGDILIQEVRQAVDSKK